MEKENCFELLSGLLTSLWKFPRFCGSRWLTMGASSRGIVLAHATGFPSAFSYLRARGLLSDWDSCGADKLGPAELLVTVVLCLASYVFEALMSELLKDSRVCVQLQSLEALFQEEAAYLDNLSSGFWELLSAIVHTPPFCSATKSCKLLLVDESLCGEVARSSSAYETSSQLLSGHLDGTKLSLQLQFQVALLGVCFKKVFWRHEKTSVLCTTHHPVSQAVGHRASTRRDLLEATESKSEHIASDVVQSSNWSAVVFVRHVAEAKDRGASESHLKLHKLSARGVMKQHGEIWNTLAARKKSVYEERARHLRQQKTLEVEEELQAEASTLQALVERESGAGQAGTPSMSMCKLPDKDLEQIHTLLHSAATPQLHVRTLRTKAVECPAPLTHAEFAALHGRSSLRDLVQSSWSQQAARLMRARDLLQGKVLGVRSANNEFSWYMYGLAVLKPLTLTLVPLQQIDLGVSWSQLSLGAAFDEQSMCVTFAWTYEAGLLETSDVFEGTSEQDLYVLDDCFYKAPGIVVSFGGLTCLKQFLAGWVPRRDTELSDTPHEKPKKHASSSSGGG
eukprot:6492494-Amphidinium_carterae.2